VTDTAKLLARIFRRRMGRKVRLCVEKISLDLEEEEMLRVIS
jgi:hypothetical protein